MLEKNFCPKKVAYGPSLGRMSSDQVGLGWEGEAHQRQQQEAKGDKKAPALRTGFWLGWKICNESRRSQTGEL